MKNIDALLVGGPLDGKVISTAADTQIITYAVTSVAAMRAPTKEELEDESIPKYTYQIHPIVGNVTTWYIGRVVKPTRQTFDDAINQILRRYTNAST